MKLLLLLVALATAVFLGLRENAAANRVVSIAPQEPPKEQFLDVQVPPVWSKRVEDMRDGDSGYAFIPFHADGKLCLNDRTDWLTTPEKDSSYITKSDGRIYVWLNKKGAERYRSNLMRLLCTPVYVTGIEGQRVETVTSASIPVDPVDNNAFSENSRIKKWAGFSTSGLANPGCPYQATCQRQSDGMYTVYYHNGTVVYNLTFKMLQRRFEESMKDTK